MKKELRGTQAEPALAKAGDGLLPTMVVVVALTVGATSMARFLAFWRGNLLLA